MARGRRILRRWPASIVALWLAVAGAGAWALVWQHMAQRLFKMIFILLTSGFRPAISLKWDKLKEHLRFLATLWAGR